MASPGKKAFLMRVDPDLYAELERIAAAELRSVNGQVNYMLREALDSYKSGSSSGKSAGKRLTRMNKRAGDAA